MTLAEVNWKGFLNPGSEQPPDVSFRIIETRNRPSDEMSGLVGSMGEFTFRAKEALEDAAKDIAASSSLEASQLVSAHKFLLAGASPVFRKQLMGPLEETSDVVAIKDTTFEAFTTMIDYLYSPPGQHFSLVHMTCPQRLCEIYNIAERYQLVHLKASVFVDLKFLPINTENLLSTVATAKLWQVFPDMSNMLLEKCATYISEKMKTAEDVFKLMLVTKESYPDADPDLLQELLRMNAKNPKTCPNCKRGLAHCVHGQHVTGLEDPPVLAKGVKVLLQAYNSVMIVKSLHHHKGSRSSSSCYSLTSTSEEVDKFSKTGDPTCFSIKTTLSRLGVPMEHLATSNDLGGFDYRLTFECKRNSDIYISSYLPKTTT